MSHKIRQRKLIQDDDRQMPAGMRKNSKNQSKGGSQSMFTTFVGLVVAVTVLLMVFLTYTDSVHPIVDGIAGHLGYREKQYAVILDAGSTGSRVLAYEFHRGYLDGRLVLDNEMFKQAKPGLSTFANKVEDGAAQITSLLDQAKSVIPEVYWAKTPLVLKATAGLRLLEPQQANNLLNAVRNVFTKSGFHTAPDAVEIMDGTDEGIFSWFTLNFLLGRLNTHNTLSALDLGGGSTQVTFVPKDEVVRSPVYKDFVHTVATLSSSIDVFTTSYLNLGLMAVRHAVFTNNLPANQTQLASECVNSIVRDRVWKYGTTEYSVSGKENSKATAENPTVDYELCLQNVRSKVLPLVKPKPIGLDQHQISAFSYFFDRAIETGLIDPFLGGEILVKDFTQKSREICNIANVDQPFMCVDLTFISVLLEEGYGLKPQTPIKLYKKIDNHEISWALGCAYNILTSKKSSHL